MEKKIKKLEEELKIIDKALDYAVKECIYWQKQSIDHIPCFQGKLVALPEKSFYLSKAEKYYSKEVQDFLKKNKLIDFE